MKDYIQHNVCWQQLNSLLKSLSAKYYEDNYNVHIPDTIILIVQALEGHIRNPASGIRAWLPESISFTTVKLLGF